MSLLDPEPPEPECALVRLHRRCMRRGVKVTRKRVQAWKFRVTLDCGHPVDVVRWASADGEEPPDPLTGSHFCPRCRDDLVKREGGEE